MDKNLVLKASGAVTETTTGSAIDFGQGGDLIPLVYEINVTTVTGTGNPAMAARIEDSADGSTWHTLVAFPSITKAGSFYRSAKSKFRYRRFYATVTGTSPSFTCSVGVAPAGRYREF